MWPRSNQWEWALLGKISSYITISNINLEGIKLSLGCLARKLWSVCRRSIHPAVTLLVSRPRNQNRFYKTISNTFTASFSLYSPHLSLSELNLILYDVTHKEGSEGLPCVASFASSLSFPRSICNHWPTSFFAGAQAPRWPFAIGTLFRRASQGSRPARNEEAMMAESGNALLSIPSAWIPHSAKKKKKKQFNSLFKATLFIWFFVYLILGQVLVGSPQHRLLERITAGP